MLAMPPIPPRTERDKTMAKPNDAEVISVPNLLQAKVGGPISQADMHMIEKAEEALKDLRADFGQWLEEEVGKLEAAAKVVKGLGFSQVTSLSPGQQHQQGDLLIQASAGARVPLVENGYLLEWPEGSLYLEPHGVLDPALPQRPVDTVISPVIDLGLPLAGNFITGASVLPDLIDRFQPQQVLASTTGGDVQFSGLISRFLEASAPGTEPTTVADGCGITMPVPGQPIMLKSTKG